MTAHVCPSFAPLQGVTWLVFKGGSSDHSKRFAVNMMTFVPMKRPAARLLLQSSTASSKHEIYGSAVGLHVHGLHKNTIHTC